MNLHTELLTLSASLPRGHRDSYFPEISHFWDVRRRLGRASYAVDERNEVDGRYDVTDIVCVDMLVIDFQSSCTLTLLGTQWTCSRWHLSCRERHECSVILNQPSRSNKWIDVSVVAGIIRTWGDEYRVQLVLRPVLSNKLLVDYKQRATDIR